MINVLIAEDDFRIADLHEKFLTSIEGVQVVGKALNATEAVQCMDSHHVDLLLLDIYMPDQLGTQLIHTLRNENRQVDFIVITAANEKAYLEHSLKNGVFSYLIKPVTIERFKETIENYKQNRDLLKSRNYVDQDFVDQLLNKSPLKEETEQTLPKGIDPLTLKKVIKIMNGFKNSMTAEEVGIEMGASRTTARRYLEYLVSKGKVNAELEYGIVGRPERKYSL